MSDNGISVNYVVYYCVYMFLVKLFVGIFLELFGAYGEPETGVPRVRAHSPLSKPPAPVPVQGKMGVVSGQDIAALISATASWIACSGTP